MKMNMKKRLENKFNFWIFDIKIRLCNSFPENQRKYFLTNLLRYFWLIDAKMKIKMKIWEKSFWPICKTFLTNQGKNEKEDKKIWKNEFYFLTLHIKIRLYRNFHENLRKRILAHFLSHFWLIQSKMKMMMKKLGKMNLIFELSISKLGYMEIFLKVYGK